jgi:hypothetical protein
MLDYVHERLIVQLKRSSLLKARQKTVEQGSKKAVRWQKFTDIKPTPRQRHPSPNHSTASE